MNYKLNIFGNIYKYIAKNPIISENEEKIQNLHCKNDYHYISNDSIINSHYIREKNVRNNRYREKSINFLLNHIFELCSEINSSNAIDISIHNNKCTLFHYQDFVNFCTHEDIIRDKNHILIGFLAMEDISFSFEFSSNIYKYNLKQGEFIFALDNESIIPMISSIYVHMKLNKTSNSLRLIYGNINDGDLIKKLEFKKIIIGDKHFFYNGLYDKPTEFMNCHNAVIIPNMSTMWNDKKKIIESRINIFKNELNKKNRCRYFKLIYNNLNYKKINVYYPIPYWVHFQKHTNLFYNTY